jgi:hypothetical protein
MDYAATVPRQPTPVGRSQMWTVWANFGFDNERVWKLSAEPFAPERNDLRDPFSSRSPTGAADEDRYIVFRLEQVPE